MDTDWEFILQETNTRYYCVLCGCDVVGFRNVETHCNGKNHMGALELYGHDISHKGHDKYTCYLCDCNISGYTNVHIHVMGRTHQKLLNESESETSESETSESETPEESNEYFAMDAQDFIVPNYDTDMLLCILCNCDVTNWLVWTHLIDRTHKKAVETYGWAILKSRTAWYYCKLCDCDIPSFKNVYEHITGRQHTNLLY